MNAQQLPALNKADQNLPAPLAEVMQYAQAIHQSGLVPQSLDTPQKVAVVLLKGQELGLHYMQAIGEISVINGQPALSAKLIASLYLNKGHSYKIIERTPTRSTIRFTLKSGETFTNTLTIEEAQAAGWNMEWKREKQQWQEKHTWKSFPQIMLTWRNLSNTIRAIAPEVLFGSLSEDEALDLAKPANPPQPEEDGSTWTIDDLAALNKMGCTTEDVCTICQVSNLAEIDPADAFDLIEQAPWYEHSLWVKEFHRRAQTRLGLGQAAIEDLIGNLNDYPTGAAAWSALAAAAQEAKETNHVN